ncbi:MAG: RraA family protein, partial [Candidatus Methanofastidiosia archaeon]
MEVDSMNERIVEFEKIPIYFIKEVVPPSYILSSEIKSIIKNKKIVCFAKTARIFSINLRTQIAALESCDDDSILVFEARECKAPAWGEMLSLLALNQGVKGTILDGIVEDKEEILNMNYPVYAREIRPKPSHQELFEFEGMEKMGKSEMDCSIVCGDVKINLGDLI